MSTQRDISLHCDQIQATWDNLNPASNLHSAVKQVKTVVD